MPITQVEPVPIRQEPDGALRVGGTRVLLELVVDAFDEGATPEAIVRRYPTLELPDVYSVIAYYLRHRDEVGEYLRRRRDRAVEVARRIGPDRPEVDAIRRRLSANRAGTGHAPTGG